MSLHQYREKKLPSQANVFDMLELKRDYRKYAMDITHVLQQDGCADVRQYGIAGDNYYWGDIPNPPYNRRMKHATIELLLRKTVVEKLVRINKKLEKENLELYVWDARRPIALQYYARQQYMEQLYHMNPTRSEEKLSEEANRYRAESPATESELDPLSPPPHSTGGALDVTIRNKETKVLLDMGTDFDQLDNSAWNSFFEHYCDHQKYATVISNRRLKYRLFDEEGFITNPTEWWHNSWGDQMWAKLTGASAAYYSIMRF